MVPCSMLSSVYAFQVGAVIILSYRQAHRLRERAWLPRVPQLAEPDPGLFTPSWFLSTITVFFLNGELWGSKIPRGQNGAAENKPPVL